MNEQIFGLPPVSTVEGRESTGEEHEVTVESSNEHAEEQESTVETPEQQRVREFQERAAELKRFSEISFGLESVYQNAGHVLVPEYGIKPFLQAVKEVAQSSSDLTLARVMKTLEPDAKKRQETISLLYKSQKEREFSPASDDAQTVYDMPREFDERMQLSTLRTLEAIQRDGSPINELLQKVGFRSVDSRTIGLSELSRLSQDEVDQLAADVEAAGGFKEMLASREVTRKEERIQFVTELAQEIELLNESIRKIEQEENRNFEEVVRGSILADAIALGETMNSTDMSDAMEEGLQRLKAEEDKLWKKTQDKINNKRAPFDKAVSSLEALQKHA